MAVTINLKKQIDLPVWEWTRFAPVNTQTVSYLTSADLIKDSRYMYYYSTSFYRYDTWTDQWMQLQTAPTAPATVMGMKYSSTNGGYRGRVLSGTTTTLIMPALTGNIFSGETIRIYGGTGMGQIRTIMNVSDPVIYEAGLVTTATALLLTDTTKKWKINQWSGYQCAAFAANSSLLQRRKILFNDTNTLYFYDVNYQQIDPWNNTGFNAVSPYAAPVATAGSQSLFQIEASTVTVDSAWSVIPDNTSRFAIQTGSVWAISSVATQFYNLQHYDVVADAWYTRTTNGAALYSAAVGTDITIEKIANAGGSYTGSTASTGTTRTLIDYSLSGVTVDKYVNKQIRLTSGTGMGQRRRIVANSGNTFTVNKKWDVIPDNTTTYEVWDDSHSMYFNGAGLASLHQYNVEADMTAAGSISDWGIARNMSIRLQNSTWTGWEGIGLTSALRKAGGIYTINTTPISGGTGYVVGEIVTFGGLGGKVIVERVGGGGVALGVSLFAVGSGYTNTNYSQTATSASGSGMQITVTSTGVVGRITTAMNHFLRIGDPIVFYGATESAWNTTYTVLGVDSLTTLDIPISATADAVAVASQTTSILVDSEQNWDVNEHVGKLVAIYTAGQAPTGQIRRITANTGTTLTLQTTITSATNATSRYIIYDIGAFGRDEQYRYNSTLKGNTGYATSGVSGTTGQLIDSTKDWFVNQWANCRIRVLAGTGYGNEMIIINNSGTTLNLSGTTSFTPDITTKYQILDSFGLCTSTAGVNTQINDANKNWTTNYWAGRRVKITSGTGQGLEAQVLSNTATQLTCTASVGAITDATTTYTILGVPVRGLGTELLHLWGLSDSTKKGRYLFSHRGSAWNIFDIYDILTETWKYGNYTSPQSETFTTGSMYAYDDADTIYMTKDATGRIYAYNFVTNKISPAGTIPYGMNTAVIGNRMEVIVTEDNLKYLYIMRHTGAEMFRTLLWW